MCCSLSDIGINVSHTHTHTHTHTLCLSICGSVTLCVYFFIVLLLCHTFQSRFCSVQVLTVLTHGVLTQLYEASHTHSRLSHTCVSHTLASVQPKASHTLVYVHPEASHPLMPLTHSCFSHTRASHALVPVQPEASHTLVSLHT